jgi:hypothetical protein
MTLLIGPTSLPNLLKDIFLPTRLYEKIRAVPVRILLASLALPSRLTSAKSSAERVREPGSHVPAVAGLFNGIPVINASCAKSPLPVKVARTVSLNRVDINFPSSQRLSRTSDYKSFVGGLANRRTVVVGNVADKRGVGGRPDGAKVPGRARVGDQSINWSDKRLHRSDKTGAPFSI